MLMETSSVRETARIDMPSIKRVRILARLAVGNLFMNRRIQQYLLLSSIMSVLKVGVAMCDCDHLFAWRPLALRLIWH